MDFETNDWIFSKQGIAAAASDPVAGGQATGLSNKIRFRDFFSTKAIVAGCNLVEGFEPSPVKVNVKFLLRDGFKRQPRGALQEAIESAVTRHPGGITGNMRAPWVHVRICGYLLVIAAVAFLVNANVLGMVLGSAVVPFSFMVLMFELNYPRNLTILVVVRCFVFGGLASLGLVNLFRLATVYPGGFAGDLLTGLIEEGAKMLVAFICLCILKPRHVITGMLVGATVGAGFSVFESAEYALARLLEGL
nr:PrsW family glutamic-type intramembrane protease [Candidatus Sigynarchaeota archaeon]